LCFSVISPNSLNNVLSKWKPEVNKSGISNYFK
jgi:hypothetical protein